MDSFDEDWTDLLWSCEPRPVLGRPQRHLLHKVSGGDGSQWSSPPLDYSSQGYEYHSQPHHPHLDSPEDSGISVTAPTARNRRGLSSEPHYSREMPEFPPSFRPKLHGSVSVGENLAQDPTDPSVILQEFRPSHPTQQLRQHNLGHGPHKLYHHNHNHRGFTNSGRIPSSLSQQSDSQYGSRTNYSGYTSPSLSQYSHPPSLRQPYVESEGYPINSIDPFLLHRRTGSPASSDSSSMTSDVKGRLRSGPGSLISVPGSAFSTSTTSSSQSSKSKGILPRPPSLPGSSPGGSSVSILQPNYNKSYPVSIPELSYSQSEVHIPPYHQSEKQRRGRASRKDSDQGGEHAASTPALISASKKIIPSRIAPPPPNHGSANYRGSNRESAQQQQQRDGSTTDIKRRKPQQPKLPTEQESGNPRESLKMKLDMVLSVITVMMSNNKEQNDSDAATFLLALSMSPDTCSVMRQPVCMNMLIQIMHSIENKRDSTHRAVRNKAAEAMRNIIEATGDTRQGKHDLCVLGVLEKIRTHCDMLFEFIASHPTGQRIDPVEHEALQSACDSLLQPIRKLYKYSNDKEKYRPSILNLGGLQATAEVLIVNYRLMACQKTATYRSIDSKPVRHSTKIITMIISILINLTYGDVNNKSALCAFRDFLKSLVFHLNLQNENIIASSAQVLRNLSWRATADIKDALLDIDAAVALMSALDYCQEEATIQYITSALWNLSAHSLESRHRISSTQFGIKQLVDLLSYNSPSGTTAVVENVGGILKNLSVVIKEDQYRWKFREANGLAKLAQHLKSKNKTVLANATGILWNLSAHSIEDQKILWDLGCIPLLDVHRTSEHKSIAENARGALRNLLAFGQSNGWTSKSDVMGYNLKTQKGLSKSLCIAASYTFSQHPSSSSPNQKHSSESLQSRSSQPLFPGRSKSSGGGSTASLSSSSQSKDRRHQLYQHPIDDDDIDYSMAHNSNKAKNRLKFKRFDSAPQASSIYNDDLDERFSYRPYPATGPNGGKHPTSMENSYPDEPRISRKKRSTKSHGSRSGLSPYCNSQSLSHSDIQGLSGAQLSNEPSETATSLSALESKLSRFEPSEAPELCYEDLDPDDLEDDDNDDIDQPIRRERVEIDHHSSLSHLHSSRRSSAVGLNQTKGLGGTGKLALDGTTNDEGDREVRSIMKGSKRTSDV